MDAHAVLSSLFFNQSSRQSGEGVARLFGMVHLYRTSGIHFLAFFTFLEWSSFRILRAFGVPIRSGKKMTLLLCFVSIFWIWSLQAFRPTLLRPIATFLFRQFFKNRGAIVSIAVPLLLTALMEIVCISHQKGEGAALHYYFAVAGGLFAWSQVREKNYFIQHVFLATGSWLPIAAYDLYHDHLVSYLTPFYSLVSLPLISYFLYPVSLLSLLICGHFPSWLITLWQNFVSLLWLPPDLGLSFASVSGDSVWISAGLSFLFIGFYKKSKKPSQKYFLFMWSFCLCIFLRFLTSQYFPLNTVTQIDVGQGDAALIQQKGRIEMVDVGSARKLKAEDWIRKLSRYHVTHIDSILLSHLDEDHVGGLKLLLPLLRIHCIETSPILLKTERGLRLVNEVANLSPLTLLEPDHCSRLSEPHWYLSHEKGSHGNEWMAGIVHRLDDRTAYFALGDGDQTQELEYERDFKSEFARYPEKIWKVSHHGSKFSSSLEFLKDLKPKQLWISVGKKNPYHHPNPLALLRMKTVGGEIHRTDAEGDLSLRVE